ncbi:hypothetical protein CR513_00173, partial [Mucuna pruriens]
MRGKGVRLKRYIEILRLRECEFSQGKREKRERERKRKRKCSVFISTQNRVVSKLFGLKGVILAGIIEGNINIMVSLNSTNYHLWKGKMKDLLFVKRIHLPIFVAQKSESTSDEE